MQNFKNNKITIITVVKNSVDKIERCIQSVINQNYDNIEYIIIDGGSNDGTIDIIKKYQYKIDKVIIENDNGIWDAMNNGLKIAKGDIVGFLNSDDKYNQDTDNYKLQTTKDIPSGIPTVSHNHVQGGEFNIYFVVKFEKK